MTQTAVGYARCGTDEQELAAQRQAVAALGPHGQPGSAADWSQVAGRLRPQFHAVAPDRPGYGSSQLPAGGFAFNARVVIDDLDLRGIERAVLVGHPYGGEVALSAASLAPDRVEAVVLVASVDRGARTDGTGCWQHPSPARCAPWWRGS